MHSHPSIPLIHFSITHTRYKERNKVLKSYTKPELRVLSIFPPVPHRKCLKIVNLFVLLLLYRPNHWLCLRKSLSGGTKLMFYYKFRNSYFEVILYYQYSILMSKY